MILFQILAICRVKLTQLVRNFLVLFFEIMVPTIQLFLFITCIGPQPVHLPLAVVNLDQGYAPINLHIGKDLVSSMKNGSDLTIREFSSLEKALDRVKDGREWGTMYIPVEFSEALYKRFSDPGNLTVQNDSTIFMYMDLSNYQVALVIEQKIQESFEETISKVAGFPVNPIKFEKPVYGEENPKFIDFLAPGMIALITFAHTIGITAISFVREKSSGTIDRIFAAGVKTHIIVIAHFFTHSGILVLQTAILLGVAFFGFRIPEHGPLIEVFTLLLLLGCVGMSYGLFISTVAESETEASQIAIASFFPALLLSGVIWPIEAIPKWFSWISYALPTTWVADGMRSIMIRGWGMDRQLIWTSYLVALAWAIFFLTFASWKLTSHEKQWWWRRNKSKKQAEQTADTDNY